MHGDVNEAFEILLNELDAALKDVRERAAAASRQGDYERAQTELARAQQIEKFIADIHAKRQQWQALIGKPRRQREGRGKTKPLPRGQRTPEEAYRLPILRALVAMGGEGTVSAVLERVYQEMEPHLKPIDLKPLPSDAKTPRWRNTAQWARNSMVREGLLRNDSPRGVWAITERGRAYLRQHGQ
ncbi:MAG TPA: winged helix-turn-helix domain-containing protein [Blastocatellia bacterium]|nr:winged helix-turn-helix domain-containing protein [Blastocatellia bacterium]